MEAVYDFLRAALPWVAMGLLLAVFFARSAKKKKDEDKKGDYGTVGMCLGMCHSILNTKKKEEQSDDKKE